MKVVNVALALLLSMPVVAQKESTVELNVSDA